MNTHLVNLVSLGMSCQSAHQLAHYADKNPQKVQFIKGPFDWLICPPASLSRWLGDGLPSFQRSELSVFKGHVWWDRYEFWFWHGFFKKQPDGTRLIEIDATMDRELSKLAHQREIFLSLDPKKTIFVWSNVQSNLLGSVYSDDAFHNVELTRNSQSHLNAALMQTFDIKCEIHCFTTKSRSARDTHKSRDVHILSNDTSEWKGCNEDWNRHLESILATIPIR